MCEFSVEKTAFAILYFHTNFVYSFIVDLYIIFLAAYL